MMGLDNILWLAGIGTETAVFGLLLYRNIWRTLPVFCVYCGWDILSNVGTYFTSNFLSPNIYLTTYSVQTVIDAGLQFCVLVELAWSVLRPIRGSLPRTTPLAVGVLILAVGVATWSFSAVPGLAQYSGQVYFLIRLEQNVSILRILFFLFLAGSSQLLSIGWRDRELQVVTGLGFYSFVSLIAAMVHSHQTTGTQYFPLNRIVIASFLCSLVYWVFSFAQKEPERREFTPQMQNFLLAVAGVARADRAALADSSISEAQRRRKR